MTDRSLDERLTRHDLLLVVIGVPLAIAALFGAVFSVSLHFAMLAGSLPASGGLGYALFYRPPGTAST